MQELWCSVPGSIMLMGEHAVLNNKRAIACAVDKRITVKLRRRSDDKVLIHSALGTYSSCLHALEPDARFTFVLECLKEAQSGVELTIESEFSHEVGLGSSAAVTAATLGCLLGPQVDRMTLFSKCLSAIRAVQKIGSGTDLAASIFGGIILYKMEPCQITPLAQELPLTLVYSGSKMKTQDVIHLVNGLKVKHPAAFETIFSCMDILIDEACQALKTHDLTTLGELFNIHHGLQEAINTCNHPLSDIAHRLRKAEGIYGAKISGSGLGDCVVALGSSNILPKIAIEVSKEGVRFS